MKKQAAYHWTATYLSQIGNWPLMVEREYFGYFLSVENIKKGIGFDIEALLKTKDADFNLLSKDDQEKVKKLIERIQGVRSTGELKDVCKECSRLSNEFDNLILSRTLQD